MPLNTMKNLLTVSSGYSLRKILQLIRFTVCFREDLLTFSSGRFCSKYLDGNDPES